MSAIWCFHDTKVFQYDHYQLLKQEKATPFEIRVSYHFFSSNPQYFCITHGKECIWQDSTEIYANLQNNH